MAHLVKVVFTAEDGCCDSVGGVSIVRQPTPVDFTKSYAIKAFDGDTTVELVLTGVELSAFIGLLGETK